MKILVLNDTHISGTNSISRVGNMFEDFMLKLDETIELSKGCDFVIHAGDLFHTPLVAYQVLDAVVDKIEKAKIPWFILPGNHDMIGARWGTSEGTSLNHIFKRSQWIKLLTELDFTNENVYIKGYPYYHNCENDIKENGLITDSKSKFKIAITHAFITPSRFRDDVLHVEIKDVKSNYNIVICSHFHNDSGAIQNGNTTFINVGAWGRRTITEALHRPQVIILSIDEIIKPEFIILQSAKAGKDVFDLEARLDSKKNEAALIAFVESLRDFKTQDLDLRGIIEYIGKEQNIDRTVIDRILKGLTEVSK